ncbi:SAVED domain-containing protein [Eubacteriaceae bacterium ES3]|nr:SAVED domain-containing protein [Eubacteriaceae bacterium ES3]
MMTIEELTEEIVDILLNEYEHDRNEIGNITIRLDKIGKIGEYIFSSILWDYFDFDCIIPKLSLATDYNMSIYGIDALYFSSEKNMLLFGESKLSKNMTNGIALLNKSLKDYEEQIESEFMLVLSNRILRSNLNCFLEKYGDVAELCIDFHEFVKEADIECIGVPVFLAHGKETECDDIMKMLDKVSMDKLFDMETKYYFISLPIIDKSKFVSIFTGMIRERSEYYERSR